MAAVAALLALYYVMAVTAASQKSMTFDEMAHLTGGYTYWAFNDYRLHPENGNWPQRLGALRAVLGRASFPRLDQAAWTSSNVYVIGDQFLYFSGNDADTMLARSRAVMALVGVALGALVYAWARRLVSPAGAWVSLILFVFSPTFLAHGALVTSDMTAALFFTAAAGAIWIALHRVTPLTVFGAAVLVAGCLLSKLSGPILAPIAIAMLAVRMIGRRPLVVALGGRAVDVRSRAQQLAILLGVFAVFALIAWSLVWASSASATRRSRPRLPARKPSSARCRTSRGWSAGSCRPPGSVTCCPRRTSTPPASPPSSRPSAQPFSTASSGRAAGGGSSGTPSW